MLGGCEVWCSGLKDRILAVSIICNYYNLQMFPLLLTKLYMSISSLIPRQVQLHEAAPASPTAEAAIGGTLRERTSLKRSIHGNVGKVVAPFRKTMFLFFLLNNIFLDVQTMCFYRQPSFATCFRLKVSDLCFSPIADAAWA